MKKKVSIKDIARECNTTAATVSRVINNKPGVSESFRKEILKKAEEMGYVINHLAASMSQSTINVAVIFPERENLSHLYTDFIIKGYKENKAIFSMYNVNFVEYIDEVSNHDILRGVREFEETDKFDAIICYLLNSSELQEWVDEKSKEGIPIILIHKNIDITNSSTLVLDDAETIGKIVCEMVVKLDTPSGKFLLIDNMKTMGQGIDFLSKSLEESLAFHRPDIEVIKVGQLDSNCFEKCYHYFTKSNVVSAFGTTARATVMLANIYMDKNIKKNFFRMGLGLNDFTRDLLKEGVVDLIIDNNPEEEGRKAMESLFKKIILKEDLEKTIKIPSKIILKSNI